MLKISAEISQEFLDNLDGHVGDEGKLVNQSDAIRASSRKTLDMLNRIDKRRVRVETENLDLISRYQQHRKNKRQSRIGSDAAILSSKSG